ncbi:hypothetical protein ACOTV5_03795 [Aliarcobacter butzleri]|uniref:hypothetical protein n=1 Tax=Aliarcobacter butzleri TaxID=28197 RepID=UPI003AFA2E46
MKTYIEIFFLPLLIVFIFSGCSAIKLPQYELKETYSEKQVLVYDKTITLTDNNWAHFLQFSPTNKDELAVSLRKNDRRDFDETTHFALIDLKSGKIKKDIELGENKDEYRADFQYLDNGNKLYLKRAIYQPVANPYANLDLNTGKLSSYYNYSCDEIIPKEYKNKEGLEAYCTGLYKSQNNIGIYIYRDKINHKYGDGIFIYDENSFKTKKIITPNNKLNTDFGVDVISEDGKYALFKKYIYNDNKELINTHFIVYDIKNEKSIYIFDSPFSKYIGGEFFINKDTLVFNYFSGDILDKNRKHYAGIVNLATNEKKTIFECSNEKCFSGNRRNIYAYNLNNRYLIWQWFSIFYIFDIKDMKIVQQFKGNSLQYTVSKDYKKVAFNALDKIYIYNIMEE